MRRSITSISLRVGRSLLRLCHLIVIKAQKWGDGLQLTKSFSSPVLKTNPSRFYAPYWFPETGPAILEENGNLPETYGETKVVLLPVHPYLIHAYWELTVDDLDRARRGLGEGQETAKPVLRFYDITSVESDGTDAPGYFDVEIDLRARNWYVPLWSPGKSYIADLGFKKADGEYLAVTRSNAAPTPRAWPSIRVEAKYMSVRGNCQEVETVPEPPTAEAQTDMGLKSAVARGERVEPEPAARAGKRSDRSKIPPPVEAFQAGVGKPDPRYEPREGKRLPSKTDEPRPFDFTELCEQRFTMGLSSRSKRTGGGR